VLVIAVDRRDKDKVYAAALARIQKIMAEALEVATNTKPKRH